MRNAGLDDSQAGIKIVRKNINNLRYADDTTKMGKKCTSESDLFYSSRPQGIKLKTNTYITEKRDYFALLEVVGKNSI